MKYLKSHISNLKYFYRKCFTLGRGSFRGQLLVELLIAIGLTSIILPALLTGLVTSREGKAQETQRLKAVSYLREAVDATRSVKNKTGNWPNFAVNGTYHPVVSGSSWSLISGAETLDGLTRQIVISDVSRDSSGNVVASGGTVDPSTKKIVVTVSWTSPHNSNISSTLYLSRYTSELFVDTTVAEFNSGIKTSTTVTNTSGGEVTLAAGGGGDWCSPNLSIDALDLPKSGVALAITAIEGRAFAGTGENSAGVSFADVTITNANPPVATLRGSFDGYKTNGVFGETGYAYMTTDTNSKEVVIIDLNQVVNGKYVEVGYFNAPENDDGAGIFVSGNIGYVTVENRLYSFDLSAKTGSRPIKDPNGVTLAGEGNRVTVVGNYAYVSVESTTTQMQIIDVSNPVNMVVVGQARLTAAEGRDTFVNSSGTRAYIATKRATDKNELFIVDVSTKTGDRSTLGSYNSGDMDPKAVVAVTGNKAIIVGHGGEEYQVVDITTESTPSRCGGLHVDSGINGISSVTEQDGDVFSYLLTKDSSSEFKIIEGGPGGQFATSGEFESRTFNAGILSGFNYFSFNISEPVGTDIKFQLAINNDNATWNYFGPDGTSNTFFETAGPVPLSKISGIYIRYKAYFSGDATSAPNLYDATINYSK